MYMFFGRERRLGKQESTQHNESGLPATSRIIDRMAERGLVDRHRDKSDGRITRIKTTTKGRNLDHLAGFYAEINSTLLDGFNEQEIEIVFDLLMRLEQNASKALG